MLPVMLVADMLLAGLPGRGAVKGDGEGAAGPWEDCWRGSEGIVAAMGVCEGEGAIGEPAVLIMAGV